MSSVETAQMSSAETGQMSAVDTRQMSSAETRQMSTGKTGRCPVSLFYICLVSAEDICLVLTADICPVSAEDICAVSTEDICLVSTPNISSKSVWPEIGKNGPKWVQNLSGPENPPPGIPRPFSRLWDHSRGPKSKNKKNPPVWGGPLSGSTPQVLASTAVRSWV